MISPNIPLCDLASLNWVSHRVPSSPAVKQMQKHPYDSKGDTHTHVSLVSLAGDREASFGLVPFMCYQHPMGEASLLKYPNVPWASFSRLVFRRVGTTSSSAWGAAPARGGGRVMPRNTLTEGVRMMIPELAFGFL